MKRLRRRFRSISYAVLMNRGRHPVRPRVMKKIRHYNKLKK